MHAGDWLLGQVPLLLFFGAEHVGKLLVTRKFPRQMVHQFLDGYEFWLLLGAQHDIPPRLSISTSVPSNRIAFGSRTA